MTDDRRDEPRADSLPLEMDPPDELETRVVRALESRDLLRQRPAPVPSSTPRWVALAAGLAAAFLLGRMSAPSPEADGTTPVPLQPAQYALVLYETDDFDRGPGEARARYDAYSRWVAEARARGQFITGEDLSVDGYSLSPSGSEILVDATAATSPGAVLSGVFLVTAPDDEGALELARALPHLRYGGRVAVQRVVPTDVPPPQDQN